VKQVVQSNRSGKLTIEQVPAPPLLPGRVLVQTAYSLVSTGTESMKVQTARQSLIGKARSRPDLVRQVINTYRKEGAINTYRKVMNRLDAPAPLGYSLAGKVVDVAPDVGRFSVGDLVACAGAGHANHAEIVSIPANLCSLIPEGVSLEAAAFTTVAAIAMQGVRQAEVTVGENVGVIGLGLVGQLAVQLLGVSGCRVFGVDLDAKRVDLARGFGAEGRLRNDADLVDAMWRFTRGMGLDAVLVCAATRSNDAVSLAGELARDRGRVVIVGKVGMELEHKLFYDKELSLRMSRSYGPGRYDPVYEEHGIDYPAGYVRWTEGRNMEAVLDLLRHRKLAVDPLITHRFDFAEAAKAYDLIAGPDASAALGIVFRYPDLPAEAGGAIVGVSSAPAASRPMRLGVIGAGNFAKTMLLPALKSDSRVSLRGIATATGVNAQDTARKFGFAFSTTDGAAVIGDATTTAVLIATRHDRHASLTSSALHAGKAVYVEKPLALNEAELAAIIRAYRASPKPFLMVGFNRRFAPLLLRARAAFGKAQPYTMLYRINAGFVPPGHWYHDPLEGGGRLVGEGCHFIDLMSFVAGARPIRVFATAMDNAGIYRDDNVIVTITFANGSVGTMIYQSCGDSTLSKERLEISAGGATAILDDFRELTVSRKGKKRTSSGRQDKGHAAEMKAFVNAVVHGAPAPISADELFYSSLATLCAARSLQCRQPVDVDLGPCLKEPVEP
jgi:predicted dehydrogenase/threonine dehydrogenase-like Zn-dependent dehydrogenase